MLRVKICGLTRLDDARLACELGADAIGFIFYAKSPRAITTEAAAAIAAQLPAHVARVGVFVNTPVAEIYQHIKRVGLHFAQLHGDYTLDDIAQFAPEQVLAVARVSETFRSADLAKFQGRVAAILLDTHKKGLYGGTGETFDWQAALAAKTYGRIILAGGLNPENVCQAVEIVQPSALDISSGVEAAPGQKDHHKLRQLFQALQSYREGWQPALTPRFPLT
jgi:phosphoribosylanthranilate isomerase